MDWWRRDRLKRLTRRRSETSNVVRVAGRDPFSASSQLTPEKRFAQARRNERERVKLERDLSELPHLMP